MNLRKKRFIGTAIGLLTAAMLVILMLPTGAYAAGNSGQAGENVYWTYDPEACEMTFTGEGEMRDFEEILLGMEFVVNVPWRSQNATMKSAVINSGITTLGEHLFHMSDTLESVVMADTVTTIKNSAFYSCDSLKTVKLSKGLKTIENSAFCYCDVLTDVELPEGLTSMGEFVFCGCPCITEVSLPESLTELKRGVFQLCGNLKDVYIYNPDIKIDDKAFNDPDAEWDEGEEPIIVDATMHYMYKFVFNANGDDAVCDTDFIYVEKEKSLGTLPVPTRENYVFEGWYGDEALTKKVDSNTVSKESMTLYAAWTPIRTVTFDPCGGVCGIKNRVVKNGEKLGELPAVTKEGFSLAGWYDAKEGGKAVSKDMEITGNITLYAHWVKNPYTEVIKVGKGTYEVSFGSEDQILNVTLLKYSDKKATSVKISTVTIKGTKATVNAIGDGAFKDNKKLKKVTVGSGVTSIGKGAFKGCIKLKTLTLGSKVTKIGDSAFYNCKALNKVVIPSKVESIGKSAFEKCSSLSNITIKTTKLTKKSVGKNAFKSVFKTAKVTVPRKKLKSYKTVLSKAGLSQKAKIVGK